MNRTYINITFLLVVMMFFASCSDDEGRFPEFQNGVSAKALVYSESSFLDFTDLENAEYRFEYISANPQDIREVEIFVSYTDASQDSLYEEQLISTLSGGTGFPYDISYSAEELASLFEKSLSDLEGGDLFDFRFQVTMTDGRIFNGTDPSDPNAYESAPDIISNSGGVKGTANQGASFTTTLGTFVGCPSDLRVGNYTAVTTAESTEPAVSPDINPIVDYTTTVTITREGPVTYNLSDVSGGVYQLWYLQFGYDSPMPTSAGQDFNEICGSIVFPPFSDRFGSPITITTSYDEATGVITINWSNGFGDEGTTVLTPA